MEPQQVGGYHETLLLESPSILCTLCFRFPRSPQQCTVCKAIYCASQVSLGSFECLVCTNKNLEELQSSLFTKYLSTPMFCPICSSVMELQNYPKHACFLKPCWNKEICGKGDISKSELKDKGVCSPACLLVKLKKECRADKEVLDAIRQLARKFQIKDKA